MFLRLSSSVAAVLVCAGFIAAGGACSDSDPQSSSTTSTSSTSSGSTGTSGGTSGNSSGGETEENIDDADCKERCGAKLTECGAPASSVEMGCSALCADGITESQATCLEGKDCQTLSRARKIDDVCPKAPAGDDDDDDSTAYPPKNLIATLTIPSDYKVQHIKSGNTIASSFNVSAEATLSASYPPLQNPNLNDATVTLDSPARPTGACGTAKFTFTMNGGNDKAADVSVQLIGTEDLPETACATFTDKLAADGATFTITNVTWPNSTEKGTVKIILK